MLDDLNRFSTTIAININDLPATSPHGSDFSTIRKFLELHRFERSTRHSNGILRHALRRPRQPSTLGSDESLQRKNQRASLTTIAIFCCSSIPPDGRVPLHRRVRYIKRWRFRPTTCNILVVANGAKQ